MPRSPGAKRKPGHVQLDEMVPKRFDSMNPMRREVEITADRARNRLGFVVIKHAGQIAPALVAAHFDQAGADHDAKAEPAKKPEDQNRRSRFRKRPTIEQRTKKDREES